MGKNLYFPRAAVTKHHRLGKGACLKQQKCIASQICMRAGLSLKCVGHPSLPLATSGGCHRLCHPLA